MSLQNLVELVRPSCQSAQKLDIGYQHSQAAATIATAVGLSDPFSDIGTGMAGSLMAIYGVPVHNLNERDLIALNATIIGVRGLVR